MATELIISADDYGVSRGVTDNILDAFDHGSLTSVSLIPNADATDYSIEQAKARPDMRVAIHLNLVEGKPLSPPEEVPFLVDEAGHMRHSFGSLWRAHLTASASQRAEIREQVRRELEAQIHRVRDAFGDEFPIAIDSHTFTHLIPFVFDELMDIAVETPTSFMRLGYEPLYFHLRDARALKVYGGIGIARNRLLKALSRRPREVLRERGIEYNHLLVGALFSGCMNEGTVRQGVDTVARLANGSERIEIVLHPGGAREGEESIWERKQDFRKVYFSPWRSSERELLKVASLWESCRARLADHD